MSTNEEEDVYTLQIAGIGADTNKDITWVGDKKEYIVVENQFMQNSTISCPSPTFAKGTSMTITVDIPALGHSTEFKIPTPKRELSDRHPILRAKFKLGGKCYGCEMRLKMLADWHFKIVYVSVECPGYKKSRIE